MWARPRGPAHAADGFVQRLLSTSRNHVFGFKIEGLGFRVWGLGFRVQRLGFRVSGSGSKSPLKDHFWRASDPSKA